MDPEGKREQVGSQTKTGVGQCDQQIPLGPPASADALQPINLQGGKREHQKDRPHQTPRESKIGIRSKEQERRQNEQMMDGDGPLPGHPGKQCLASGLLVAGEGRKVQSQEESQGQQSEGKGRHRQEAVIIAGQQQEREDRKQRSQVDGKNEFPESRLLQLKRRDRVNDRYEEDQ